MRAMNDDNKYISNLPVTLTPSEKSDIREHVRSRYRDNIQKEANFWNHLVKNQSASTYADKSPAWMCEWRNRSRVRSKSVYEEIWNNTYVEYDNLKQDRLALKRYAEMKDFKPNHTALHGTATETHRDIPEHTHPDKRRKLAPLRASSTSSEPTLAAAPVR